MKVLFLGPYRDVGGYSQSSRDFILCMDAAGIDVVCRPIKLDGSKEGIPAKLEELEKKSTEGCTIAIQCCLPSFFEYDGHFAKNIGLYHWETNSFPNTNWAAKLNTMDEVWVVNKELAQHTSMNGVIKPIRVIHQPTNIEKFYQSYDKPKELENIVDGSFKFYTIGEATRRKNLAGLLKAFHLEFHPDEPVELIVKTNYRNSSPEECLRKTQEYCNNLKKELKLGFRPKDEIIITRRYTEEEICGLHYHSDCFVSASHGEAWNIEGFDAMGFGKTPILTDVGGHKEYLYRTLRFLGVVPGNLISGYTDSVFGVVDTGELYSPKESWFVPSLPMFRLRMREIYENEVSRSVKAQLGLERVEQFSYEHIGRKIRQTLEQET